MVFSAHLQFTELPRPASERNVERTLESLIGSVWQCVVGLSSRTAISVVGQDLRRLRLFFLGVGGSPSTKN